MKTLIRTLIISVLSLTGFSIAHAQKSQILEPQILEPQIAYQQVKSGTLTLIDVRRPEEWAATGVPEGARPITMHGEGGIDALITSINTLMAGDKTRAVAVICRSGNRSARVAAALSEAGFTHVYDVSEGVEGNLVKQGWARRGLPVTAPEQTNAH